MFFKIRNWEKFQHYKKRNPPWIRLYQTILRERAYQKLSDTSRSHLVGLFVLASQHENRLPDDQEWLRHELCTKTSIDLKTLAASNWIEFISIDASMLLAGNDVLAERKQVATPETDSSETDNSEAETDRPLRGLCGAFGNVKLSVEEFGKLVERFGQAEADKRIETLSEYVASKGKKYSSHYATILSWERKNGNGNNGNGRPPSAQYTEEEIERERLAIFGPRKERR